MILLVSGSTRTVREYLDNVYLGVLLTPSDWARLPTKGTVWACDNAAFTNFDPKAYRDMLKKIRGRDDCLWVTVPDVVANHAATLHRWHLWAPEVRHAGQTPAFVCQDGCKVGDVPWDDRYGMAVFIGGSTRYKLSADAVQIVQLANDRGVWTHMGRVNTVRRIKYAHTIGCRSFDGSQHSKWGRTHIPKTLAYLAELDRQHGLEMERSA